MKLFTINWNGGIIPSGDTANWGVDALSCFSTAPQFIAFNAIPPAPKPLVVSGSSGSTADPNMDGKRKAAGVVAGVVFGN